MLNHILAICPTFRHVSEEEAENVVAANLRAAREGASPEHVREGSEWYPAAGRMIDRVVSEARERTGAYDLTFEFGAAVFAIYSLNSTWAANQTMAANYLNGLGQGGLPSVMAELSDLEDGASPREAIRSLKRPDFWSNLTGDLSKVTCDRWHILAGFGRKVSLDDRVHRILTNATRRVAAEFGEAPATTQAIIWCAVRGTGA